MSASAADQFLANWSSQARKGVLELVIMSVLAEREFYGYELVEHLQTRFRLQVSDGTLYAILTRIRAEGLVRQRWEHAASGPARKYYALSAAGHKLLGAMQETWREIADAVDGAMAPPRGKKDV